MYVCTGTGTAAELCTVPVYGDGKTLLVDISRMATRYHDLEISGEFASCHLLADGRIVSPSYTNAMKGSCKVFP